MTTEIRTNTCA